MTPVKMESDVVVCRRCNVAIGLLACPSEGHWWASILGLRPSVHKRSKDAGLRYLAERHECAGGADE